MSSTFDQSGVRGRGSAPAISWARIAFWSRLCFVATGSTNAERLTGSDPARASAICAFLVTNHFWNVTAFWRFGADTEMPEMKMPIWAIEPPGPRGTVLNPGLPTSFDCFGSSDLMALPEYWTIDNAFPPRMAAPSWSESYSTTPGGAIDLSVWTKNSVARLPAALLSRTFQLLSKICPPWDMNTGNQDATMGLPLTPRKTYPYDFGGCIFFL